MNYTLPKTLNKNNVLECLQAITKQSNAGQNLIIDASYVHYCDTAALALLLDLYHNEKYTLVNYSPAIMHLAGLYQLPFGKSQ
jgi:ABC-type transporter Mla MlaB component